METLEVLKDKIEELRSELHQAIADGLPSDVIYAKSLALDRAIEQYFDMDIRK